MPLRAAESGGEKGLNQLPSEVLADHEPAETDQVEVVIFDALVRRKGLVNQTGADAGNLVCGDRGPDSAATDRHRPLHGSAGNRASQRHDIIWVIIVELQVAVSEINYVMTSAPQLFGEILLQLEAAVVSGNANKFRQVW